MTMQWKQSIKPWKPHKYQFRAVKFLLEHACAALFLDPGLGKTAITLAGIKYLKAHSQVEKALVVAPLRVCHEVWPEEIKKWKDFKKLKIEILHGPDKDAALRRKADIYVINPEGLEWLLNVKKKKGASGKTRVTVDVRRFKNFGFDLLVVDELSKFKHPKTNRFKAIKHVLHTFGRRWGLTGSPMTNGLLDLFGQCYILDMGNALGQYISHYKDKYFEQQDYQGYVWAPMKGAAAKIYKRLEPLALRMSATDYLDMPEIINDNIFIELPPKVQQVYRELETDLFTRIDKKVVVAANAAAASTKCRQVASGGVYYEDPLVPGTPAGPKKSTHLHDEKTKALVDLIDELQGAQLLVAYDFAHDLDRIRAKLGKDVPYIGGGTTTSQLKEIIRKWNAGKIQVLLAHPKAAGHGLNLQSGGCNHICWYSITWDYELYDQFIRRVHRQGNKNFHVFVYHILARGTIDPIILRALHSKERGQQALFNALTELRAQRMKGESHA